MIKNWLQQYEPKTKDEADQALREIMQEIVLAGLQRGGFFEKAAFYGGTCLRILYGLDRFSEDLDFSLLEPDPDFSLSQYEESIISEFEALGIRVTIKNKIKSRASQIDSAFLKSETIWKELELKQIIKQESIGTLPHLKIKLEVDRLPPSGFETEEKLLIRPYSFYVKSFTLPDLFAGKMHALLFRKWKTRVKGRDWYDLEWYIRKGVRLHLKHLALRAKDSGDWNKSSMSQAELADLFQKKVKTVSFNQIRIDAQRFVKDPKRLDIWSADYFTDLFERMKSQ